MNEELKSLQRQVVRQERLTAVGLLVSGVAHEVNNPLQAILGTAELLERHQSTPRHLMDEIAFLKDYVEMHSLLMPGRAQFTLDVEPGAWNALIPVLLLQPLVESAVLHVIAKLDAGGNIRLVARRNHDRLALSLRNDAPASSGQTNGTGIGLANTRERLRVLYGDAAAFHFLRGAGSATVEIELPLSEAAA